MKEKIKEILDVPLYRCRGARWYEELPDNIATAIQDLLVKKLEGMKKRVDSIGIGYETLASQDREYEDFKKAYNQAIDDAIKMVRNP